MATPKRRAVAGSMAFLVIVATIIPPASIILNNRRYVLSMDTKKIIGTANPEIAKKITFDGEENAYYLNKDGISADLSRIDGGSPEDVAKQLQKQRIGAKDDASAAKDMLYSAKLAADPTKGVTYYENNVNLSFSLIPDLKLGAGRTHDDRIVFPAENGAQLVYTGKGNGLKEDFVLQKPVGDSFKIVYKLDLPKTLEARMAEDGSGSLGIYSADSALFGQMSYGSADDRASVMQAQTEGEKSHLLFVLPAPTIKSVDGKVGTARARFILSKDQKELTIDTSNLNTSSYPLSIDPSVVITSTSDFQTNVGDSDNIDFSTPGQITRGALTGGVVAPWQASANTFTNARHSHVSLTYGSYLYVVGGVSGLGFMNDVQYAPINADGSLGAWQTTTSFNTPRMFQNAVAYNDYIYVLGGEGATSSTTYADVQFAPLSANGAVGNWSTSATPLTSARYLSGCTVYQGYIYVIGGAGAMTKVEYAPLSAVGELAGPWASAYNPLPGTGRAGMGIVANNGYMYIIGGMDGSTYYDTVLVGPIKGNGDISHWAQSNKFTTPRYLTSAAVSNNRIYLTGGSDAGSISQSDTQIASIREAGALSTFSTSATAMPGTAPGNRTQHKLSVWGRFVFVYGGLLNGAATNTVYRMFADLDGTVSSATAMPAFTTARYDFAFAQSSTTKCVYVIGGTTTGSDALATVSHAAFTAATTPSAPPAIGTWAATSASLPTARRGAEAVSYNGYLYVIGGRTAAGVAVQTVDYVAIPAASCVLPAWSTYAGGSGSALTNARYDFAAFVSNGYIYVLGGNSGSGAMTSVEQVLVNTNGTLANWSAGTALPSARSNQTAWVRNDVIYVAGGTPGSGALNSVLRAQIGATNGTIGTWSTDGEVLPVGRSDAAMVIVEDLVLITGGTDGTNPTNTIYYTFAFNGGGGGISTWSVGSALATADARSGGQAIAYKGYMYFVGGYKPGPPAVYFNTVSYAPIGANGANGAWVTSANTFSPVGKTHARIFIRNGYLYVFGGSNGTTYYNDMRYAAIDPTTGNVGVFSTVSGTAFTTPRDTFGLIYLNDYVYIFGGYNGSAAINSVYYAKITADGAVGAWTAGPTMLSISSGMGCVYNNGFIYLVGGSTATASLAAVNYIKVNTDGTLDTTWRVTTSMQTGRYHMTIGVYNGYLFVNGGVVGSSAAPESLTAPFNADGTLGNWSATFGLEAYSTARAMSGFCVYNGYMYIVAGWRTGSTYSNSILYAGLEATLRASTYSRTVGFDSNGVPTQLTYNGDVQNGLGAFQYKLAGWGGVFGPRTAMTVLPGMSAQTCYTDPTASAAGYAYMDIIARLDDTTRSVFPDSLGTASKITDISLDYRTYVARPNERLRQGKYFATDTNTMQPMDTCKRL